MRELRQNASRFLDRVSRGETIEVTDRGRPVARLVPIDPDPWIAMVATGRVSLCPDEVDVADEEPGNYDLNASAVLEAMRSERA